MPATWLQPLVRPMLKQRTHNSQAVEIDGRQFGSIQEAMDETGLSRHIIMKMIGNGEARWL